MPAALPARRRTLVSVLNIFKRDVRDIVKLLYVLNFPLSFEISRFRVLGLVLILVFRVGFLKKYATFYYDKNNELIHFLLKRLLRKNALNCGMMDCDDEVNVNIGFFLIGTTRDIRKETPVSL